MAMARVLSCASSPLPSAVGFPILFVVFAAVIFSFSAPSLAFLPREITTPRASPRFRLAKGCRAILAANVPIWSRRLSASAAALHAARNDGGSAETEAFPDVAGVTLKMAFDSSQLWAVADLAELQSERFTCDASLDLVHRLRRISDCVLVGRSTVEKDNCTLTVRRVPLSEGRGQPVRVVIDPTLRVLRSLDGGVEGAKASGGYAILRDGLPAIIYHSGASILPDAHPASDAVTLVDLSSTQPPGHDGGERFCDFIAPSAIISDLASRGIKHVMVEGGPATALSFLNEKLVDRAIIIRSPVSFGVPVHSDISEKVLERAGLEEVGIRPCGEDVVHYWSRPGVPWPTKELMNWP